MKTSEYWNYVISVAGGKKQIVHVVLAHQLSLSLCVCACDDLRFKKL